MFRISKNDLLSSSLCGYNGNCPQFLSASDGQKILVGKHVNSENSFTSRFTEIIENFGLQLLKSLEETNSSYTVNELEDCVKNISIED